MLSPSPGKHEAPLNQIANDFGIPGSCVANWLKKADVEDGVKPGVTEKESAELRDARKRIGLLEQEAEVMRRAVAYLSWDVNPKMMYRWSLNWPSTVSPSR
ncbi:hypothetical protein SAMN05216281_11929 [Cryobacterium luteum]|nr:hypothetical protein SAMN05216281_11929 [Cryobacterium luteum]